MLLEIVLSGLLLCSIIAALYFWRASVSVQSEHQQRLSLLQHANQLVEQQADELQVLKGRMESMQEETVAARTSLEHLKEQLIQRGEEKEALISNFNAEREERTRLERALDVANQRIEATEEKHRDWEVVKAQYLEATKASILELGGNLSNKLLDDHKREHQTTKEEQEQRIRVTTEKMYTQFENVVKQLSAIDKRVDQSQSVVDHVQRALLNPPGAGALAEVTLENIFKASGLEKQRDYIMQYWVAGDKAGVGLRPDALVFLPQEQAMVVDSKASKFFMDIVGQEEDELKTQEKLAGLKRTMQQHLKSLQHRDYRQAVTQQLNSVSKNAGAYQVAMVVMFLPTDQACEIVRRSDPNLFEKAIRDHIVICGPSGLVNILLQSKIAINDARQSENTRAILHEVHTMIQSIAKLQDLSEQLGKGLKSSFDKYDKFAASFNRNFLSKVRKVQQLGVSGGKYHEIGQLKRYQVISEMIDADAKEAQTAEENKQPALTEAE